MKILVSLKRVVDYRFRVKAKPDGTGVALEGAKMSINPFDEIAIEEALRIKERGQAKEVVVVSIGGQACEEQLRQALAMGAERAIRVDHPDPEPTLVAAILAKLVAKESPNIVFTGKQAIDDDANQVPQMLAGLLGWAQTTFVSKLELSGDEATATREVDEGLEVLSVKLPAVISVDLRLNEPRFIKLPEIMKAKKKPLEVVAAQELVDKEPPRAKILNFRNPPPRQGGKKVKTIAEVVAAMKDRGVI